MSVLSNLSIRRRLTLGFGILLILMVTLTVIGVRNVNFIDDTLSEISDINAVKQRYAIDFRGSVHDRAIAIRDIALATQDSQIHQYEQVIAELSQTYARSKQQLSLMRDSGIVFSQEERDILRAIDAQESRTLPLISHIITAKKRGSDVTTQILEQVRPAFIDWLDTINQFIDYQEHANQIATPKAREVASGFSTLMLCATAIAVLVSIVVGLLIERSLRQSLGAEPFEAEQALATIASGDLSQRINSQYSASMMASVVKMQTQLAATVTNIANVASALNLKAQDVSQSSQRISESTKVQTSMTQSTAASLDQLRASIQDVSAAATQTEQNSTLTLEFATQGQQSVLISQQQMELIATTMANTVARVQDLERDIAQITGITQVINGISDQTNLLALNAAIEAARAGQAGKGFAVVADEVRKLAQDTHHATKEIDQMIGQISTNTQALVKAVETTQPQVESGREQVMKTHQLLDNITNQARDSLSWVSQLATNTQEQTGAIADVTSAMDTILNMSQDAQLETDNNQHTTEALTQLSFDLQRDIDYFHLGQPRA
ncbi:methyl-accepting chemotaxis protein [Vibrio xiamenensis]|uniref:methyl-accepting chemotaxis protein n=1 Tax=Vibrio xiamenensis TaxID=861298 RepID=UPI000B81B46D|nr:methyl-accepting chemotaxis protein [Vibrio xiamenensis]